MSELSDEEYGRRWAAMMKRKPYRFRHHDGSEVWRWESVPTRGRMKALVPVCLAMAVHTGVGSGIYSDTEAGIYAALGCAVRLIHATVPPLESPP